MHLEEDQYFNIDNDGTMYVYCMWCRDTKNPVAIGNVKKTHYRTYRVELQDGSYANIPVCIKCESRISNDDDFSVLYRRIVRGWDDEMKYKGTPNREAVLNRMKKNKGVRGPFHGSVQQRHKPKK